MRCHELLASTMVGVANAVVRDRGLAEDVVQDVFVRVVRDGVDLRRHNGASVRAFFLAAARNGAIDATRRAHRRDVLVDAHAEDHQLPVSPAAETEALAHEVPPRLRRALATLPPDQAVAVYLRHVEGLSGTELADVLERSRPAAYALVKRAERAFIAAWGDDDESVTAESSSSVRGGQPPNPPAHTDDEHG